MAKQPETIIKKEITDYLRLTGWFVFPILQGMGAYKGISDLIACRGGVVLFIEVKTPNGKLSDHQVQFMLNIHKSGCRYLMVRCHEEVKEYIEGVIQEES